MPPGVNQKRPIQTLNILFYLYLRYYISTQIPSSKMEIKYNGYINVADFMLMTLFGVGDFMLVTFFWFW